jgi:hypothetical protein
MAAARIVVNYRSWPWSRFRAGDVLGYFRGVTWRPAARTHGGQGEFLGFVGSQKKHGHPKYAVFSNPSSPTVGDIPADHHPLY